METLSSRVLTSVVGFILVSVVIWLGWPAMLPILILVSYLALFEYTRMLECNDLDVRRFSLGIFSTAIIIASFPMWPNVPWDGGSWREVMLSIAVASIIVLEVIKPGERPLERIVYSIFGLVYIPWLLGYFLMLRYLPDSEQGLLHFALPLLATFATDIGGFFVGYYYGKRKLAPEVSPGKTVEGAVGGLILSFAIVLLVTQLAPLAWAPSASEAFLYAILVASASQLGDLSESLIKRALHIKDSGTSLPGHGGILDRIDGLLFAVPATFLFLHISMQLTP